MQLESEYDKLQPRASRTIRDRQRFAEVETRLSFLARETSRLRTKLKHAPG
jgi:hypothetical protein